MTGEGTPDTALLDQPEGTPPRTSRGRRPAGDEGAAPPSRAEQRRVRSHGTWALRLVPPTVAFLFAEALLYIAAVIDGRAAYFFHPDHWTRWDSGIYVSVAAHGPTLTHCTGSLYPPHSWCGTAGWAPLYPWLIAILGHLGFTLPGAGAVLAALFAYLTLLALWVLIGPSWSFTRLCCLALGACFPGMIYYYAVYPISLVTFLTVVCLILFIRQKYWQAGLVGALSTWAFASGPVIIGVLFVAALIVARGPRLWRVVAQTAGVALAGFVALLLAFQVMVGNWMGYLLTQSKYSNGLPNPVKTFVTTFTGASTAKYPLWTLDSAYDHVYPEAQAAFVAALVIGLVIWTLTHRPVSRANWVILCWTVAVWLAPYFIGPSLARYRLEALLVPCVALCTRLPRAVLVVLVAFSAVLAVGMANLYTQFILF